MIILTAVVQILVIIASTVLAVLALRSWFDLRRSRRLLAWAWGLGFAIPFVIAIIPVRIFLQHVPAPRQIDGVPVNPEPFIELLQQLEMQIGLAYGTYVFVLLAPTVLTVFPALLRAGLYTKTLIPESAVPGWVAVIVPLFYVMLSFAFFSLLNQLAGDFVMVFAVFCLVAAPLLYVFQARTLTRPMNSDQVFPALRLKRTNRLAKTL